MNFQGRELSTWDLQLVQLEKLYGTYSKILALVTRLDLPLTKQILSSSTLTEAELASLVLIAPHAKWLRYLDKSLEKSR